MKQLYLTFRKQAEYVRDDKGNYVKDEHGNYVEKILIPLGYGAGYDPSNPKLVEKNKSQDEWAYSCFKVIDGVYQTHHWEWDNDKNRIAVYAPALHQPQIIDNVPLDGFKVNDYATRYSTSNKLIRILDPRGFELEISVQNLLKIIESHTIINGIIQGKFKWDFGKNGIGKATLISGETA